MATLYIRKQPQDKHLNKVHSVDELRDLLDAYIPGTPLFLGDYAEFDSRYMRPKLLKFIEDNPEVSLYSSEDMPDPILLSRFSTIEKEPRVITPYHDDETWYNSKCDYGSAAQFQCNCSTDTKLRLPLFHLNSGFSISNGYSKDDFSILKRLEDLLKSV